jgi:nitroreductase
LVRGAVRHSGCFGQGGQWNIKRWPRIQELRTVVPATVRAHRFRHLDIRTALLLQSVAAGALQESKQSFRQKPENENESASAPDIASTDIEARVLHDGGMNIQEAVATRRSVRHFLDTPVAGETIRRVLEQALRAPSGGNLQPWHLHVVGGEKLDELKAIMRERLPQAPGGEGSEYDIYPRELVAPYRDRRYAVGEQMYARLGIPRTDKPSRLQWFARNYEFFGAPLALFCSVDRRMGPPQWSDLGMMLQSVMLLLRGEGLDSCAQECWAMYPKTIGDFLSIPPERMLFTGMAIGHADPEHALHTFMTERAPLGDVAEFMGI